MRIIGRFCFLTILQYHHIDERKIDLPPLIENEKQKQQILETFKKSRERYRNFRSKLKQDIEQSNGKKVSFDLLEGE
jgi:hypothetical protein